MSRNGSKFMPVLRGTIERRVLLNYRVDPDAAARLLPAPFRPQVVGGHAVAGVCLIRLARLRPRGVPAWLGLRFENAAIRVAAEWDVDGATQCCVFVLERYTASPLASWAGGRIFPGVHHRARFEGSESARSIRVGYRGSDGTTLSVAGEETGDWPTDSVFASAAEASAFFAAGSLGYSWNARRGDFDGMELCVQNWRATPLAVHEFASSYFDDEQRFPPGSIALDHALLMRDIEHEWRVCDSAIAAV
ncbi:MAG: DUF2071 domain-containing protein [Pirellulales bacterium]